MKKRSALVLFGSLFGSVAAYVAWCWRPFYLAPELEFSASVSPGGRQAVESWAQASGLPGPIEFEASEALAALCEPWKVTHDPAIVAETPQEGLWVRHGARIWKANIWTFAKVGGAWQAATARKQEVHTAEELRWLQHREIIASRVVDEMAADDWTLEILSLHPLPVSFEDRALLEAAGTPPETFHDYPILGRAKVPTSQDKQELMTALARSIREAQNVTYLCFNPRHGIVATQGDRRVEYLICFECETTESFRNGSEVPGSFKVTSSASNAFNAFLDRHRIQRAAPHP